MKAKTINSFDEMVEEATRSIHSALLEGGGKEMKSRVFLWLSTAIQWSMNNHESKNNK